MPRVERGSMQKVEVHRHRAAPVPRHRLHDTAIRIDRRGDAIVRIPQKPATVLNRAHPEPC